ncbi:MAG: ABC transporter ATP-binding protein [Dehalococcoidia bacterium]|nr:ABC transporter ATP-binding protein [Dehalococcoidia bacterium]
MLTVKGLDAYYGKLHVLWDIGLQVGNESVGIFGPNGAGKTTLINCIVGLIQPTNGLIEFEGQPLLNMDTHRIVRSGISVVPQERELFPLMTVAENLEAGAAYIRSAWPKKKERLEFVYSIFPVLKLKSMLYAAILSGGEQRMLAIARALMASPRLLILDEPSTGLQPSLTTDLFLRLKQIRQTENIAILVAEQNVRQCLKAIERGYVIENGKIALQDSAASLSDNDYVRKSYLGL